MSEVRTRIAPSPTGFFHIGNAKTALYNWLFARQKGGSFILRLEDTDVERSKPEYADVIGEALRWLGIDWDEGPGFGGTPDKGGYGPYRQSERRDLYLAEAQRLLDTDRAYKCFWSKEEMDAEREQARAEKRMPQRSPWRDADAERVAAMGNAPHVIRFRVPEGVTVIKDLLQGNVRVDNREIDDFVIVRSDGHPVFHLAVVVDDGLMKITHVIRGDDHLTNAAKHVLLFEALGYPLPVFVHHPLVHDAADKKYSKRLHGAKVLDWRRGRLSARSGGQLPRPARLGTQGRPRGLHATAAHQGVLD
ncbi:MAG TPA: glutamate--tRNA ligase [Candidatus Hydrogenedentes bacterium]|nr:glutamate--tRNA ligase [Candidatus Hydrogenedentota bacterium]